MPETSLQIEESSGKDLREKEAMLESLAVVLCNKFNKYADKRSNKEQEWRVAMEQYEGHVDHNDRDKIQQALGNDMALDSVTTVNITRPKTNVAVSRMQDIQFPLGGNYNFTIRPTPVSEGIKQAFEQEEPTPEMQLEMAASGGRVEDTPSPKEIATDVMKQYLERARNMNRQIKDNLEECNYGTKARRGIDDLCILGTTVMKGPFVKYYTETRYVDDPEQGYIPQPTTYMTPSCTRVDPRYYYPDPSAREPGDVEDEFELHLMTRRQLIELADSPAFMSDQVKKVLEAGTNETQMPSIIRTTSFADAGIDVGSRFVVHEYHGPLPKEVLEAGGIITEEELDDATKEYRGSAWFVDRTLIRLSLPLLQGQSPSPYHVTRYEPDPNSLFGHGVPYLLRHMQRIINNSFLMLMDNAALTSMPQIVLNQEMIEPAGRTNDYTLRAGKVWLNTEYGSDVREAMQFINVPANSEGLSQIVDMALAFADLESSIPMMQQGEMPVGNNTMSGMATVLSALNIVQKRASMAWDDNITKPMINGFYHYNMQYSEDENIKGDMHVVVGGATERIDSQMKAQDLERILGLAQASEEYSMQVDSTKAFRELVSHIRGGDILRSEAEVQDLMEQKAQQEQQPDPEVMKAQASIMTAQTQQAEAQHRMQRAEEEFLYKRQKDIADMQIREREIEARNQNTFAELQTSAEDREIELAKLAQQANLSVSELANKLNIAQVNNEAQREKAMIDLLKQREEITLKKEFGEGI